MIADEVAGLIPGGKQLGPVGVVHAHAANEQRHPNISFGNGFQNSAVGFVPFQDGTERERWIVDRQSKLGPRSIVGRSFRPRVLWKWKGLQAARKELGAHR